MSFKRWVPGLVLLLCCVLILSWLQLHRIAETAIQTRFGKLLKDQGISFIIHDIGLFRTRMGELGYKDLLFIENAEFSYRPGTKPAMESWRLSGLVIDAGVNGNKLAQLGRFSHDRSPDSHTGFMDLSGLDPAVIPRRVEIRNGLIRITLDRPGTAPLPLTLPFDLTARVHPMDARAEVAVNMTCLGQSLRLEADLDLNHGLKAVESRANALDLGAMALIAPELFSFLSGTTDVTAEFTPGKPLGLTLSAIDLGPVQPGAALSDIQVTLTPKERDWDIMATGQLNHPAVPPLPLQARFHLQDPGAGLDKWQCELGLRSEQLPSVVMKGPNRSLELERPHLNLKAEGDGLGFSGDISFTAGVKRALVPQGTIKGGKVRGDFTFTDLPKARQGLKGRIRITDIGMEKPVKLKPMDAGLDLEWSPDKGVGIKGRLIPDQLKLPPIRMTGRATLEGGPKGQLSLVLPQFSLSSQPLRSHMALPGELSFTARASARVEVVLARNGVSAGGAVELAEGEMQWPDMGITAQGIHTRLSLADLFTLRSQPGQILSLGEMKIGRLAASNARIRYGLESGGRPLVENLTFSWCRGQVSSEVFRLPSPGEDLDITLYCDRLFLSDILHQIGGFTAEGEGTVSGRIPIHYRSGKIGFNNGFLFSTPGKGGRVRVMDTEQITQGLPMDSPQFVQLDLTREALKDFTYKWARLNLNTREEQLVAALQMDGQPNGLLPFVFQKEIGGFARVKGDAKGSRFQGITLNLNLKLPLNQVMKLGKGMNELLSP